MQPRCSDARGDERKCHENKKKYDLFFCRWCVCFAELPAPAVAPVSASYQSVCCQHEFGHLAAPHIHPELEGLAFVSLNDNCRVVLDAQRELFAAQQLLTDRQRQIGSEVQLYKALGRG